MRYSDLMRESPDHTNKWNIIIFYNLKKNRKIGKRRRIQVVVLVDNTDRIFFWVNTDWIFAY